ncbi:hypothetical protein AAB989_40235, partial [Burkholderia contaminans]
VVLRPVEADVDSDVIELVADDRPVDADVLSDVTVLFVVLSPVEADVDSDVIELVADDRPVDADVLNDVTVLFVVLRPVERLEILDTVVLATAYSWLPLTASVLADPTRPAATFWTRRSLPALPTLTIPPGAPLPA